MASVVSRHPNPFPEARGCFCGNHYITLLPQGDRVTIMSNHTQSRVSAPKSSRQHRQYDQRSFTDLIANSCKLTTWRQQLRMTAFLKTRSWNIWRLPIFTNPNVFSERKQLPFTGGGREKIRAIILPAEFDVVRGTRNELSLKVTEGHYMSLYCPTISEVGFRIKKSSLPSCSSPLLKKMRSIHIFSVWLFTSTDTCLLI